MFLEPRLVRTETRCKRKRRLHRAHRDGQLWQTGFPCTSINANHKVVGSSGSNRFPGLHLLLARPRVALPFPQRLLWSPRCPRECHRQLQHHHRQQQRRLSSLQTLSHPLGRAFTARLRLIGSKWRELKRNRIRNAAIPSELLLTERIVVEKRVSQNQTGSLL
jgi:hypothetical protein